MPPDPTIAEVAESMRRSHLICDPDRCDTLKILDALRDESDYASSLRADLDRAEAALTATRKLHAEYEGRCGHCVEWCDCLDEDPSALVANCTHGNVPWPCPTRSAIDKALTVVPPPHVREWLRRTAPEGEADGG